MEHEKRTRIEEGASFSGDDQEDQAYGRNAR